MLRSGATAVMAFDDQVALGSSRACAPGDLAQPVDVSLVGSDDAVPMAAMIDPPLTTNSMPTAEVAPVDLLAERGVTCDLAGAFVIRASTAAVPDGGPGARPDSRLTPARGPERRLNAHQVGRPLRRGGT